MFAGFRLVAVAFGRRAVRKFERQHHRLKARLAARNLTLSDIARSLDVAPSTVTIVSKGFRRSRRIETALAEAVGTTPDRLWPARYRLHEEGALIAT
ncbi:hypothetical protein D3C85_1591720 [compost metagenome]